MALAIEILLAAAVLLAVGLAAAGRIDGMSRAVPDAPPGLPAGPVTPEGLRGVTLPVVLRGYRMADVDEILERTAAELEAAQAAAARGQPGHQAPESTPYPEGSESAPYPEGSDAAQRQACETPPYLESSETVDG